MEAKNPETKANSTRNLAKPKLIPNPYCRQLKTVTHAALRLQKSNGVFPYDF
jgi:hypothetical protein